MSRFREAFIMRIVVLAEPDGNVIAREDQLGRLEAEFVLAPNGQVIYRHPWDRQTWFAGPTVRAFREAADAWNHYCEITRESRTEVEELEAVSQLRAKLTELKVLTQQPDNLWAVLVEQAQQGLL